jgi:hypothetical protein
MRSPAKKHVVGLAAGGDVLLGNDLVSKIIVFGAGLAAHVLAHPAHGRIIGIVHGAAIDLGDAALCVADEAVRPNSASPQRDGISCLSPISLLLSGNLEYASLWKSLPPQWHAAALDVAPPTQVQVDCDSLRFPQEC